MKENVERCGGIPVTVDDEWGRAVDPAKVDDALGAHPDARILAFVHAETSTGARSDIRNLTELARRRGVLTLVDTVTSLGGCELRIDDWGVDAAYAGVQKCLSCTPGLAPVTFSERALHKIRNRKTKVQSWFLDLNLVMAYWGTGQKRAYHHTAPVNALYGLHEALLMIYEEGLEAVWQRHARNHALLKAGLEGMGLQLLVPPEERLAQINTVVVPEGVDDARVRSRLLEEFGLEIGAGLGTLAGKVWRIGLMGYSSRTANVLLCLGALEAVLSDMKAPIITGAAMEEFQRAYRVV